MIRMKEEPLDAEKFAEITDYIINNEILIDVEFTNITPALVGGWLGGWSSEPGGYTIEPPRPTDIIGKTRWWARAILGGLIYELTGYFPTLRTANELISEVFGRIDRSGKGSKASKLVIMIENTSPIREIYYSNIDAGKIKEPWNTNITRPCTNTELCPPTLETILAIASSGRVKLQLLGKHENYYLVPLPPYTYKFRIKASLREDVDPFWEALLGYSLALALRITGIGRNTNRSYGKLKAIWINTNDETIFGSRFKRIMNIKSDKFDLQKIASDIICDLKSILNDLEHRLYGAISEGKDWNSCECPHYPYYPVLHPFFIIDRKMLSISLKNVLTAIYWINELTLFQRFKEINACYRSDRRKEILFKLLNGGPRICTKNKEKCKKHFSIEERIPSLIKYYMVTDKNNENNIIVRFVIFNHQIRINNRGEFSFIYRYCPKIIVDFTRRIAFVPKELFDPIISDIVRSMSVMIEDKIL